LPPFSGDAARRRICFGNEVPRLGENPRPVAERLSDSYCNCPTRVFAARPGTARQRTLVFRRTKTTTGGGSAYLGHLPRLGVVVSRRPTDRQTQRRRNISSAARDHNENSTATRQRNHAPLIATGDSNWVTCMTSESHTRTAHMLPAVLSPTKTPHPRRP